MFGAPIKLEEAYKSAIQKTEFGAILDEQKKQYEARIEKAGAALYSPLSLKGSYAIQQAASPSNYSDAASLALNLTQPVYQGGQLTNAIEEAKLQQKSKEFQNASLRLTLYASVANSFYSVITAEKDKNNVETVITQTKDMIIELEKRKVIGKAKYSEVLMAEAQLAVLESDLEGVMRSILTSRDDFAFLTGLPKDAELDGGEKAEVELKDLTYYLGAAAKRPDISALQSDLEAARLETVFQSAFGLPWVSLNGNYYPYRTGSSSGINWDLGLALTFKLFDFGDTGARVKEAQYKEKEAELNLAKKKRQVEAEVKSAYGSLKSLREQVKKLENSVDMNGKNYLEQKKDYDFSLVTNLEVLQAMNALQNAKKALDRIKLEVLLAGAKLLSAGALVPGETR
ncbi:MAG: hypothetical protein A2497_08120 [Candidatus Firestonebacteria bacterium RifOxyC12_full_39_7]|nr:MAG: hypothetical protein A2497_08120 [Candidatus Firestonebacteria bacterium RifOxyC12_full_39_7]